ncbi:MAG TPA: SDR family NAD(P)-dependent oxidoreductase [Bacteroidota bacterium]|nr:SDR family NAD(P)-dependent oxidoreductase [Bacteroidota bacterium]
MKLEKKTAIVTGAGKGIGKAIALALSSAGANVVVAARTQSDIDGVAHQIREAGGSALSVRADVSKEEDVRQLVSQTLNRFGRIDILINNAGIGSFANVESLSVEKFDRMWEVNVRGVFLCSRAVIPAMSQQKSGDIINIASLAGRNAFVGGAGYCSTKWALVGFARCLMLEVRAHNIRVITLCPGSVDTDFGDHEKGAPRSQGIIPTADDVAQVVVDTISMPRHVMVSEVDIRPTNPKG